VLPLQAIKARLTTCSLTQTKLCTLQDVDWVHERLCELVTLLPDIVAKLNNVKADLLLQLLDTKVRHQTGQRRQS
jgi:hypothetical protein